MFVRNELCMNPTRVAMSVCPFCERNEVRDMSGLVRPETPTRRQRWHRHCAGLGPVSVRCPCLCGISADEVEVAQREHKIRRVQQVIGVTLDEAMDRTQPEGNRVGVDEQFSCGCSR